MPYIFIWAGFVFRGMKTKDKYNQTITHTTQGSIESHFGTTKAANGHTGLYPAEYCETALKNVLASCQVQKSVFKSASKDKSNSNLIIIFSKRFNYFRDLDEQSAITARDVFQRQAHVKAVQNKADLIKIGAKKRAAARYQQPNTHTLTNLDKKLKIEPPTPQLDLIIDEASSTPTNSIGKYDCIVCDLKFSSSGSLCQHKKTEKHKRNA